MEDEGVLLPLLLKYWPAVILLGFIYYAVGTKYHNGLHKYPSAHPLASYTNWWRYFDVRSEAAEQTHLAAHEKHGDIVRLGPNVLSFGNPHSIKAIYGLNKGMTKSDFYPVQQAVSKGERLQSLFSTKDEAYHSRYRRCVNAAFSMTSLIEYEPLVDSTMDAFIEQTRKRYCDTGRTCRFSQWLQFFAFDVIGEITWSKRLGFVERDEDVEGIVGFVGRFLKYAAPIGQMPFLDLLFEKNPLKLRLQKWGIDKKVFAVTKFALEQAADRASEKEKGTADGRRVDRVDLLSKFTQAQRDHPEFMTDKQVLSSCTSMIFAGSETTAISLSSVFSHLAGDARSYQKLMHEIDLAVSNGIIAERENRRVSWAESLKLPYLDAVIQESFRMHPAPGLILERVVPPQGLDVLGERIPAGTIVGCNAWVLHRRREVFGSDVDTFRPERWLEARPGQLKEMKSALFQFGAGARTCIGKNISLLEIYKLVPTFLRNFELEMEHTPRTSNAWFVSIDFYTKIRRRRAAHIM